MTDERRTFAFGLLLAFAWMALLFLFLPMVAVAPISLTDRHFLSLPQEAISFQHYAALVDEARWRNSILQSLFVGVASAGIATVLGTLCAIGCWRITTGMSELIRFLMLTPIIVPGIVHALAIYRMWIDLRLLDTFTGVILANVVLTMPYVVIMVSAVLANFDLRLEQAARSLGATIGQTIRWVIIPAVKPGIVSGAFFAFISTWDEIVVLLFITSRHVYLLPRAIWDGIHEDLNPSIAAVATVFVVVTSLIFLVNAMLARRLR